MAADGGVCLHQKPKGVNSDLTPSPSEIIDYHHNPHVQRVKEIKPKSLQLQILFQFSRSVWSRRSWVTISGIGCTIHCPQSSPVTYARLWCLSSSSSSTLYTCLRQRVQWDKSLSGKVYVKSRCKIPYFKFRDVSMFPQPHSLTALTQLQQFVGTRDVAPCWGRWALTWPKIC